MASQARPILGRMLLVLRKAFAWIALAAGLFMLWAWVGSSIPRNSNWEEPENGIPIMIETNGIHTGIVMPLVTEQMDWRAHFPASDLPRSDRPYTHISISWGEREVFLNTPQWADISLPTIVGAATGGDGLLHVAHYVRPGTSPDHRELIITEDQYANLVDQIEQQILPNNQRPPLPGYADYDVFYDAPGVYHLGHTCNQWTSDNLAAAGIKTGWWTPFAGGVMKWVPEAGE